MKTARPSIPIVKATGVYLYSQDGRRYLDGISSWWVNLHGHSHPYMIGKIKAQLDQLQHVIFADFTHAPAVELASRLVSILPGSMSKIFYSDNGSTAVEVALKIALQYWTNQKIDRTKVICFKNSYHGDTFGAMSAAGRNAFNKPFWKHLFAIESIDPPIQGQEEASLSQLQTILRREKPACFIFEPLILAAGGMIIYSGEGLRRLIECCREHEVLIIADEVMTGFGRTGPLFASEQSDLICLSKGLTGGFLPLGATACTEKLFNAFLGAHPEQTFLHGHSYTANPLACVSACASLDLLMETNSTFQRELIANSHKVFCQKWSRHPKLKRCESLGTILVLEYKEDNRDHLYEHFLSRGVLLRPLGSVLYVLPPYCISEDELKFVYDQIIVILEGGK